MLVRRIEVLPRIDRSQSAPLFDFKRKSIVLLSGISCLCRLLEEGSRQITSLYFPGDFCNLHSLNRTAPIVNLELKELIDCTFGAIDLDFLNDQLEQHPSLSFALWRAVMVEMYVSRTWLLNAMQKPAMERVAHLICEILARQETSGLSNRSVLLTQLDIADAAGLSAVHVNRTLQVLRGIGALSGLGRAIEVGDLEKLQRIAGFDGKYLKFPGIGLRWDVKLQIE